MEAVSRGLKANEVWLGPTEIKILTPYWHDLIYQQTLTQPCSAPLKIEGAKFRDLTIRLSLNNGVRVGATSSIPEPTVKPITAKRGQVVQEASGYKYVAASDHIIDPGARILNGRPHEEGTEAAGYDYTCGSDYCRCMQ